MDNPSGLKILDEWYARADERAEEIVRRAFLAGLRPDPQLTVSECAEGSRILSAVSSAIPGPWRNGRVPYAPKIMDALSHGSPYEEVIFMKGAQIGGTEIGNNWLHYIVTQVPRPTLMVYPTVDVAKRVSKQRIAPMIADTPALRERVREARSRDSRNTTFVKEFAGGILIMTGANSPSGLRSMPICNCFFDEVDGYDEDAGGEGDPTALAWERTSTFSSQRKAYYVSTPKFRDHSRIEKLFLASDQQRFFVHCVHCGWPDWIQWRVGGWRGDQGRHHHIDIKDHEPATAQLRCAQCDRLMEEGHKPVLLAGGEWRPTAPDYRGRRIGFHLSALYSPLGWKSWADCAKQFFEAGNDPLLLQVVVNTMFAETWEEKTVRPPQAIELLERTERYVAEVPAGVGVLVASIDRQADRLEVWVKGYGAGEESWLIAWQQQLGDPSQEQVYVELDEFLMSTFTHESGRKCRIECVVMDIGGKVDRGVKGGPDQVYRFAIARNGRSLGDAVQHVFAIKGGTERGLPLVGRPAFNNPYKAPLYTLCVDSGKATVIGRLPLLEGPGRMHFPDWLDEELAKQLTAEKAVYRYPKVGKERKAGGVVREWVKTRERNEALDLEVYSLAALYILGQGLVKSLGDRAAKWAIPPDEKPPEDPQGGGPNLPPGLVPPPRPGGWVTNW